MGAPTEPTKREPPPKHIVDLHKTAFDQIRKELGSTADEIFAKEASLGRRKIGDALTNIISWKSWNSFPLSNIERAYSGREALFIEVNNGGFHQYFFNSSGDDWRCLLEAFKASGDEEATRRFQAVLNIFPNSLPEENRQKRWKQLEEIENKMGDEMWSFFKKHDDDFYESPFPGPDKFWNYIVSQRGKVEIVWI